MRMFTPGFYLVFLASLLAFSSLAYVAYLLISPSDTDADCHFPEKNIGGFVTIDGGGFLKSDKGIYPEEGSPAKTFVSPFLLQIHEVTNSQFAAFVDDTGYVTDAEKMDGSALFVNTETPWLASSWWKMDKGATWKTPYGIGSDLAGRELYPVVHVTLNDARAYAEWAGGRIPNETEWEYAASLGLFDPADPESGVRSTDGTPRANVWNGTFPVSNTEEDGFSGLAPIGCYEKSLVGAYDMIGNVWEWTESRFGNAKPLFTIKGGSYLCGSNFCRRYRAAARQGMEQDLSTAHIGFRIVKDIQDRNSER